MAGTLDHHKADCKCNACRGRQDHPDTSAAKEKERGIFEKRPGEWWIQWFDEQGRRHREKAGTKSQARLLYQKRQTEKLQGKKLPELNRKRQPTVADLIEHYRPQFELKKSAKDDDRYARYWVGAHGATVAETLRPGDVEAWRRGRLKEGKAAPATVNRAVAFLKRVYNVAIRDGIIECPNPVSRVKQLRENNAIVRYLRDDEESRLRAVCSPELWTKIEVAFLSGLRQGEQFRLKREDLDFQAGVITIKESKHGETRRVPMTGRLRELFKTQLACHEEEWVWPGKKPGCHFTGFAAINALKTALRKAGIRKFRWHDLRHTFCSRLAMAGVSLATIQQLAGHKTITVTQRYAHLSPEHNRAAMEKLSSPQRAPVVLDSIEPEAIAAVLLRHLEPPAIHKLASLLSVETKGE